MQVNDSPVGAQAFFPFVTVSRETGLVYVLYYSNEESPPPGTLLDVFIAVGRPGGRNFRSRRVTNVSSNPNADPSFGVPSQFIGDYIWVDVFDEQIVAAWTDFRTGSQDIFAGLSEE